jgi:hypothetical protein
MAIQNPEPGNSRTAYKMVALITLWVDDGPNHEIILETARQIVTKELYNHIDSAGYKIGDTDEGFSTSVEAIELIKREELH